MKKIFTLYLAFFIFSLIISIPLIIPYLHPGYFPTHDGEWAVVRLADMFREIRDLQIPPRFSGNLNFGYGYPLFNFAYPFPYYVGVVINFFGIGLVDTIKLLFGISIPISAFFMFLASRNVWKNDFAGIVSAVLYLYFPYRLVDLFVRGSMGESLAFALFPIILYCLSRIIDNPKLNSFKVFGATAYASLILTHNISAILFSMSLLVFLIGHFLSGKIKSVTPFLFVFVFGLVLSAFFWIPALLEKGNIVLSRIPIADRSLHYVSLKQLFFDSWGFGQPTDQVNGFTYQLGWPFLIVISGLIIVYVLQFIKRNKRSSEDNLSIVLLFGIAILSLFLFSFSSFFWKLPILSEINYPWIMLSQLGLLISLLAGYLTKYKYTKFIVLGIAFLALFLYIPLAKPFNYIDKGDSYYLTNDATTTSSNELMPIWVKESPTLRPKEKVEIIRGKGDVNNLFYNSKKISFDFKSKEDTLVRINSIYYPGWNAFINNRKENISYDNSKGLMEIKVLNGSSRIVLAFGETPIRLASDIISAIGLIVILILLLKGFIKKK